MKTIIAGSRDIYDMGALQTLLFRSAIKNRITEVVSGGARGVDSLGEVWAKHNGIPIKRFPADWIGNGKAAGHIRNVEMAKYAGALLFLWDGKSRGTLDMINQAMLNGLYIAGFNMDCEIFGFMEFSWPAKDTD